MLIVRLRVLFASVADELIAQHRKTDNATAIAAANLGGFFLDYFFLTEFQPESVTM